MADPIADPGGFGARFLIARLSDIPKPGNPGVFLRVMSPPVPKKADGLTPAIDPPYILIGYSPQVDTRWNGGAIPWAGGDWAVKAVVSGTSRSPAIAIAQAIHERLDMKHGPIPGGGYVTEIRRTVPIDYPDREEGRDFYHLGGSYSMKVTP